MDEVAKGEMASTKFTSIEWKLSWMWSLQSVLNI